MIASVVKSSSGCAGLVRVVGERDRGPGPTLPVRRRPGVNVWQAAQPALVKTALPFAASPARPACRRRVDGPRAVASATFCSCPKYRTAPSIAMKNTKQSGMYQRRPFLPGEVRVAAAGSTNDDSSAKVMKIAPVTARPISCDVERAKTIGRKLPKTVTGACWKAARRACGGRLRLGRRRGLRDLRDHDVSGSWTASDSSSGV